MTWLAVLFFLGHEGVLIVSGLYSDSRYIVAAGTFVIPLLALLAFREGTLICAAWQVPRGEVE
jgi:tetrahydromethanopterin S-methyltransferase subunit B